LIYDYRAPGFAHDQHFEFGTNPIQLQLRFLFASRPLIMGQVLGIVYRAISMHLVKKAGYLRKTARTAR
jgi:hypothetical protein